MIGTLIGLTLAASAIAAEPGDNLVFSMIVDGNKDLFLATAKGSILKRLTTNPAPDEIPRCSPDGKAVVFLRGGFSRNGEIFLLNLQTGEERRLTNNAVLDMTPQWSPDGNRVYFTTTTNNHDRIAEVDLDGRNFRYVTPSKGWNDTMPGVSPDGQSLVHHTYRYGKDNSELHLHRLRDGRSQRLTEMHGHDYEASFAGPRRVLFSSNRDGMYFRLYALSLSDGSTRLLADTGGDAWGARYSPHSHDVLFYTGSDNEWRLRRVAVNGGPVSKVLQDDPAIFGVDWCQTAGQPPGRGASF